jgi:hypothetical protein
MSPVAKSSLLPVSLTALALSASSAAAQTVCKLNGQVVPCDQLNAAVSTGLAKAGWMAFVAAGVVLVISIWSFVFWIQMIIHAASNPIENKALWIIVMVIFGIVGAIIYYFAVKRRLAEAAVATQPLPQPTPMTGTPTSSEPPLAPQLVEYIRAVTAQGQTKDQIKTTLVSTGWNAADVDRALR